MTLLDILATVSVAVLTSLVTIHLARMRTEREFQLEYKTEELIKKLLEHENYRLRTFKTLKHHIGGYDDNELRRILLRSGALKFEDNAGIEVWGLLERNEDRLTAETGTRNN
ncbi:hypothetical protein [Qipengyuania gelatinilytica]|uniref:Uncharacterized protein n=1 Tax=Qipengyuania gelatinilytica TaxID=2867231 RepID=A0ABX9A3F0_9SPHN|nr:hypothetical protein [Qipengyuania gelatinilytica]QZD95592.1 hypothetical protein K3136_02360 [Qipengyuania gelatinilytica]